MIIGTHCPIHGYGEMKTSPTRPAGAGVFTWYGRRMQAWVGEEAWTRGRLGFGGGSSAMWGEEPGWATVKAAASRSPLRPAGS